MFHMWWYKVWTDPCKPPQCYCTIFYEWLVESLINRTTISNWTSLEVINNKEYDKTVTSACWRIGTRHEITVKTTGEISWRTWNSKFVINVGSYSHFTLISETKKPNPSGKKKKTSNTFTHQIRRNIEYYIAKEQFCAKRIHSKIRRRSKIQICRDGDVQSLDFRQCSVTPLDFVR